MQSPLHYLCRAWPGRIKTTIHKLLRTAAMVGPVARKFRTEATLHHPGSRQPTASRALKVIREHRQGQRPTSASNANRDRRSEKNSRKKVSVIAWDVGHNSLGRAYLLADVLRNDYDVEIVGASFPKLGEDVWAPLRTCSRVTIKSFPGEHFPKYFSDAQYMAKHIDGDVLYVSKPRLPGLELAILAKQQRNRPIILDVDDYELGFFKNRQPMTLDAIRTKHKTSSFNCPYGEMWSRYSESLIPLFDQITVSNIELQKKFGGTVLPHLRDEHDFTPMRYPRAEVRKALGFTSKDRVIIFAGTPLMHKGFMRVVVALRNLNRPNYKGLLIGSPPEGESRTVRKAMKAGHLSVLPCVPFCDLPGYLCAGDLICLLQDEQRITSHFQLPAKFTDGLAMEIPMLATNVPVLKHLAKDGLVELLKHTHLEEKIEEIFSNYERYKCRAMSNRGVFLQKYSYGANLCTMKHMIERVLQEPTRFPDEFVKLIAYHGGIFQSTSYSRPAVRTLSVNTN